VFLRQRLLLLGQIRYGSRCEAGIRLIRGLMRLQSRLEARIGYYASAEFQPIVGFA
jgi:hypothetical protein